MTERSTPRERARVQTMADITRIGRMHLARDGAAALSLRAVARDLGVVSSAVYRYVASRDELLTLLVVDAYTELADAVDVSIGATVADPVKRIHAGVRAMRAWALAEPTRWALLYGSPVPGYAAPAEQTTGPGVRVMLTLFTLAADAQDARPQVDRDPVRLTRVLRANLKAMAVEAGVRIAEPATADLLLWWSSVVGLVSGEVFGHLGADTISDPDALFTHHVTRLDQVAGLSSTG